ncbi:MAG: GNAT family N-acetyltransferase [Clostridiales bacterium]|nr:GNAT family N-acetyltransferase [Clostridiales bacterium]
MELMIRNALPADLPQLVSLEQMSYPAAEAASPEAFAYRLAHMGDWFFAAEQNGLVVGLMSNRRTDLDHIDDALYEADGRTDGDYLAILSVVTDPQLRKQGIAAAMIRHTIAAAQAAGLTGITLACKEGLVPFYAQFGFVSQGVSSSIHGGTVWYDMKLLLRK